MNVELVLYPVEALFFDYLSFGFFTHVLHSVWTWIAVITAVFSFWRIKTFSILPRRGDISVHVLLTPKVVSSSLSQVERVSNELASSNDSSFAGLGNYSEEGTKGKLMVYYKQDEDGECNRDDERGENDDIVELCEEWFENWERLLKMRKGEMGWYSYQNMKVIDGNVVKLWRNAESTTFSIGKITTW